MERLDIAANRRLRGLGKHQTAALIAEFARGSASAAPVDDVRGSPRPVVSRPTHRRLRARPRSARAPWSRGSRQEHPEIFVSVSATTRPPRPGEVDGVHYLFVTEDEFDAAGRRRTRCWSGPSCTAGTATAPRAAPVLAALAERPAGDPGDRPAGRPAGPASLARARGSSSWPRRRWEELVRRLVGRGTESAAQRERRLETARAEMAAQAEFDHVVVNGEVGQAVEDLVALVGL